MNSVMCTVCQSFYHHLPHSHLRPALSSHVCKLGPCHAIWSSTKYRRTVHHVGRPKPSAFARSPILNTRVKMCDGQLHRQPHQCHSPSNWLLKYQLPVHPESQQTPRRRTRWPGQLSTQTASSPQRNTRLRRLVFQMEASLK